MTVLRFGLAALLCAPLVARAQQPRDSRDLVLERRVAVVIGNNAYAGAPLLNAVADGRAVSAALRELGFSVTAIENASRATMAQTISSVAERLTSNDIVFFFFAGHGIQIRGENYLIPTDFVANSGTAVRLGALAAADVEEALSKAKVSMIVLDACRNNPFGGDRGAAGLAPVDARGSLVAFATASGQTASDNSGAANGLFTQHLVLTLREPSISARDLFYRVRQRVHAASGGQQVPAIYDNLIGDVILGRPATAATITAPVTPAAPAPAPAVPASDGAEIALWNAVEKSARQSDYEAYLSKYPAGVFAALARNRIAELKASATAPKVLSASGLVGTEWSGIYQDLNRRNEVVSESALSLSFAANGEGRAIYWDGSKPFKWELVGGEILIRIDGFAGWNPRLRGRITGDAMAGNWSDPNGDNSKWSVTFVGRK
jgi:uncharacterized caspase-like protein